VRNTFINTVIAASRKRKDIFIISQDAGLGVFDTFKKESPDQFLNLGVAEQNATSFAAGLALLGHKVYLYNIIPFLLYRAYEQVRNDICYQKLPIVLVGIGSGLTYAPQGVTHYSVEDIGIAQTLPNLKVFSPIDPVEAHAAALFSLQSREPVYVRLPKSGEPRLHREKISDITEPQVIAEGKDIALIFHGSIGNEAIQARELLKKTGISARLISVPMLQPPPLDKLFALLSDLEYVVSVEEHYVNCGLGSMLARAYAAEPGPWHLFTLGIPAQYIHEIKDNRGMREHFGISARGIVRFIRANCGSKSSCMSGVKNIGRL
jgi:transketolase